MANIVGAEHVSSARADRIAYSADFWPKAQIWKMAGDIDRYPPDCVVWPGDPAEVQAIAPPVPRSSRLATSGSRP